jgi:hypothetical protein
MPRNQARGGVAARIVRTSFRGFTSLNRTATGTSIAQLDLTPGNLGSRAGFECENYEFFRVTDLRVISVMTCTVPGSTVAVGGSVSHAISFNNSPVGSQIAPTNFVQMAQAPHYALGGAAHRISFHVGRKELLAEPLKWFNTESTGSVPANQRSVGTITLCMDCSLGASVAAMYQYVILEGTVEYHTPIDPNDSMRFRVPRAIADDPAVAKAAARLKAAVSEASPA